jgi:hypothetical protein
MKAQARALVILIALLALARPFPAGAGIGDFLKGLGRTLEPGALSEDKIVRGLKEALEVGVKNAVSRVSQTDGYLGNPDIRIPLPETLGKVEGIVRGAGYGARVDAFHESMNRAAERAAPQAQSIFWEAVRGMSIEDARGILEGPDDAATSYLREKTSSRLEDLFRPEVHGAMARVDVTRRYQELTGRITSLPFVGQLADLDLDGYVTREALDGLFYMLAREERSIRQDPAARVTDLLKEVFGRSGSGR